MTQYVGCEQARDLLEGLVDGELSMADQLAVESHLRWCRTCALRVADMQLIGNSLRSHSAGLASTRGDAAALVAMNEAVLMRVRAEHEQSFAFRLREMFIDMRLLWPALGASAAVALCLGAAAGVLQASTSQKPQSLAALISTLADPGSERNPLRPVNTGDPLRDENVGVSIPRVLADDARRTSRTLEWIPEEDVIYAVRTVITRDGRVSNFEVLLSDGEPTGSRRSREHDRHARAVIDALQQSRFAPGTTPLGRAVAVDTVWLIAKTTAVVEATPSGPHPLPVLEPKPPVAKPAASDQPSTTGPSSPTA